MTTKKVIIKISELNYREERNKYHPSVNGGKEFTDVMYSSNIYGGCSPCDTKQEIKAAITDAKKTIKLHGDTYEVRDMRVKQDLTAWL